MNVSYVCIGFGFVGCDFGFFWVWKKWGVVVGVNVGGWDCDFGSVDGDFEYWVVGLD